MLPSAPLAVFVPMITAGNYVVESIFARWWMSRYLRARAERFASAQVAEVAA
jgi:hypothetical protein